jgi:hypothetical protein
MNLDDADQVSVLIQEIAELAGRMAFWVALISIPIVLFVWAHGRRNVRARTSAWGHVGAPTGTPWRFNPPPGWPPSPPGFVPPPGWQPDPSWPPVPPSWQWWTSSQRGMEAALGGASMKDPARQL